VSRRLIAQGLAIVHIVGDRVERHQDAEQRLLKEVGSAQHDIFRTREELIEQAYCMREAEIAYRTREGARCDREARRQ
jgi:hypothetical protein